jgi:cytochrome c oxidase subunit 4
MANVATGALHVGGEHHAEHEHPGERTYIKIALILSAITVIEVAIYYFNLPHSVLVTALLIFSAIKFVIVVGYFMHLKFDDKRLLWIFLGGLLLGGVILIALDVLQHHHQIDYAQDIIVEGAAPAGEEAH